MNRFAFAATVSVALLSAACASDDGYESGQQLHGLDADAAIVGVGIGAAVATPGLLQSSNSFQREPKEKRRLQTVQGQLVDSHGVPLAQASITVRQAAKYVPNPDKLPTRMLTAGPDGGFTLDMAKADFLCVDFSAPGMQTQRRWFIALNPRNAKGLPQDKMRITFVSPEYPTSKMMPLQLSSQ